MTHELPRNKRQMAPKGLELEFCHFFLLVLQTEFNIIE